MGDRKESGKKGDPPRDPYLFFREKIASRKVFDANGYLAAALNRATGTPGIQIGEE